MLLAILLFVAIQSVTADGDAEEKRLLLHSGDDIASELMTLKAELATTTTRLENEVAMLTQEVSSLKASQQNASEISMLKAELVTSTKRFENEVSALTQELNSLKVSQQNDHGAVYTRWGRNVCPNDAELVYHGYIAGKKYNDLGGNSDNLCLPYTPTWGNYTDVFDSYRGHIYGTEIDIKEPTHIFPYPVYQHDLPCAVCKSTRKTSIMIPARINCYPGWNLEYTGYLASAMISAASKSYDTVCLDSLPEFVPHGGTNDNEHVLYLIESRCGSLPCPPYVDGRELACVVCTI